ncbi:AarF/ABC1/UbiB kinase family protein [Mangrovimicrobium sediminis]|uniref:AarF/ABC1/UbiB kinase family protein n=2 Tax=Mangrovimicrobium sediminis TaxID=2562682 RepID=A0A4Z0M4E7_9GAMM|nr:AarF/ABC1/UbiB kinase family protein [Haliea sp. SAOS-164]
MAGGVAGGMLAEGARQWRAGNRPSARDMLLTPGNAKRVADQLATMRGAAMKVGQMLSMDAGDFLPRELADILARLRSAARYMPRAQLQRVMREAYGEDWFEQFASFEYKPLAAASIGQVHRAQTLDGRDIVLKVQYPGVAASIDADVDNIASLLRLSGLLPAEVDIQPLLDDAKAQLREEADYLIEAKYLATFGELLAGDERFRVPEVLPEFTRSTVLAMTYVEGEPIEGVVAQAQDERDRVMSALIELMFRELFELRMVQTDPNFANYHYDEASGRIVLLDFGATRRFKAEFVKHYRSLAKAAIAGNHERLLAAAERIGYATGDEDGEYRQLLLDIFLLVLEPLQVEGEYDFGESDMLQRMSAMGEEVGHYRDFWQAPPTDAMYFHRKLGGMFLLATRLKARVDVKALLDRFL